MLRSLWPAFAVVFASGAATAAADDIPALGEVAAGVTRMTPMTTDEPLDHVIDGTAGVAQAAIDEENEGWAALPLATVSPETELGLGAFGIYYFRTGNDGPETRPSSIGVVGIYTTRGQAMVETVPEIYWDHERTHWATRLDYRYFPDTFWGIGNDMPDSAEENYDQTSLRARSHLRRRFGESLWLGVQLDAQHLSISNMAPNGHFLTGNVPGAEGGRTIGFGTTVGIDTRDSAIQAFRGFFYQVGLLAFLPQFGSEYTFAKLTVDLRHFIPLGGQNAIGLQLYGEFTGGDVPFNRMALLGGSYRMRGFYEGRYRDNDMILAQAEYRFPLFWRFSGVAFAGVGDVMPSVEQFDFTALKWAIGGGLRFALSRNERLNVRVDVGVGLHTQGVYVSASEAF